MSRILQLGLAFWGSKTLLSAVELGVFTELGRRPLPTEVLIGRLGLNGRGARDFLDALVALDMLKRDGETYTNTPAAGLFLDRSKPSYIGGLLEMANARLYPFWGGLTTALMLHIRGIDCEIYEQSDSVRELGVGINTLPHAIKELAGLGLLERLDAVAIRTYELI